jgi:hypothetical protein
VTSSFAFHSHRVGIETYLAKSLSSITCIPRMVKMRDSISDFIRFCSIEQTYFVESY